MSDRQYPGFPIVRLGELRVDYPSLGIVREQKSNGHARMLVVSLPDTEGRVVGGKYKVLIDVNDLDQVPLSYLLNNDDVRGNRFVMEGGRSRARYDRSSATLPGTNKKAWWICHGNFDSVYSVLDPDPVVRLGAYLNHIISLLNWK